MQVKVNDLEKNNYELTSPEIFYLNIYKVKFFFYMGDNFERNLILTSSHIQTVIKNCNPTYTWEITYVLKKTTANMSGWIKKVLVSKKNLQQFFKDVWMLSSFFPRLILYSVDLLYFLKTVFDLDNQHCR